MFEMEEQKQYLAEHFDPENMTYREYQSFLDTLCRFGILEEPDKNFLNYGVGNSELELIPLEYAPVGSWIAPQNARGFDSSFASSGGNVLDWTKYRAACRAGTREEEHGFRRGMPCCLKNSRRSWRQFPADRMGI